MDRYCYHFDDLAWAEEFHAAALIIDPQTEQYNEDVYTSAWAYYAPQSEEWARSQGQDERAAAFAAIASLEGKWTVSKPTLPLDWRMCLDFICEFAEESGRYIFSRRLDRQQEQLGRKRPQRIYMSDLVADFEDFLADCEYEERSADW